MTRQYDVRTSSKSPQKDADNWILQRTAVRSQPAKTLTPQSEIPVQRQEGGKKTENKTGLPDHLKAGIENLSGYSMDAVRVHYNSDKPEKINALAYTQGIDIHMGPGQERHLPHESWHVVQQLQGRVEPTVQARGLSINDDAALESEADVMGVKAMRMTRIYRDATNSISSLQQSGSEALASPVASNQNLDRLTPNEQSIQKQYRTTEVEKQNEHPFKQTSDARENFSQIIQISKEQDIEEQSARDNTKARGVETKTKLNQSVIQRIKRDRFDDITKQIPEFSHKKMERFWQQLENLTERNPKANDIFYLLSQDKTEITDRTTMIEALEVLVDDDEYTEETTRNFVELIQKALIEAGLVAGATSAASPSGATDEKERKALLYLAEHQEHFFEQEKGADRKKLEGPAKKWLDKVGQSLIGMFNVSAGASMAEPAVELAKITTMVDQLIITALSGEQWAIYTVGKLRSKEFFTRFAINADKIENVGDELCHHTDWSIPLLKAINATGLTKLNVPKSADKPVPITLEETKSFQQSAKKLTKQIKTIMEKYQK